jgi:predicted methyltransferase
MSGFRAIPPRRSYRAALFLIVLAGACAERSVRPGINDDYRKQGVETWVEREKILDAVGVRAGMAVADIGAGTGFFTRMFSQRVGASGRVYAVDITPSFIERIQAMTRAEGLTNVTTVLCTDRSAALPAGSVDLVFVCDTYHHFEFPRSTLQSIHRALRPGGVLVVVDFERIPGQSRPWVLDHVRAGRDTVKEEIIAEGFALLDEPSTPWLKENYVMRFRRTP